MLYICDQIPYADIYTYIYTHTHIHIPKNMFFPPNLVERILFDYHPPRMQVTTRILPFLIGNPYIDLH